MMVTMGMRDRGCVTKEFNSTPLEMRFRATIVSISVFHSQLTISCFWNYANTS